MFRELFGDVLFGVEVEWLEFVWKVVLLNKVLLFMLWQEFENYFNLFFVFFEDDLLCLCYGKWIKKFLFLCEGVNILLIDDL